MQRGEVCAGAYLEKNFDVADAVADPVEALFHYLEFGLAEGRDAGPTGWEAGLVERLTGIRPSADKSAAQVLADLRRAGVAPQDCVLTEVQFWLARGVHGPVMAQIFQHEVYFALADAAGLTPPRPDRLSCVEHYCEIGLDAGLPPHPAHRLDADDNRASLALLDINAPDGTAAGDLQRHWARIGLRAGAHASVSAWFRVVQGISLPAAIDANLQGLAAQITALPNNASRPRVAMHLAAQPKDALAALDMADCTTQGFFLDLADARHRAGATAQAEAICAAILSKAPDHQRTAVTLANILHRDPGKRIDEEIALRRNIPADFDAGATAVALAERLFLKHAYAEALTALQEAQTLVQGNVAMTHRLREVARHVFERVWGALPHHVARLDVAKVQDLLAHALALYTPLFDPVERTAPIRRVAIMPVFSLSRS